MVVLIDGIEYRFIRPENERNLEEAVRANHTHIFGHESLYFDVKHKMKSRGGVASIPDGYAILFVDPKPKWCIVEVELASHPLYDHIVAQLTKFNRGIENASTRKEIVEALYETIKSDLLIEAQVKRKIKSGEIYKFVLDVVSGDPIIVIVIDERTDELDEALKDIRGEQKVVEFRTYQRVGVSDPVHAYVFNPVVRMTSHAAEPSRIGPSTTQPGMERQAVTDRPRQDADDFVNKKPEGFSLFGQTFSAYHWQDILLKVCELMRERYPDRVEAVLLGLKSGRYSYFSRERTDLMDGQGLLIQGTSIYAATKLNANAMIAKCRQVIRAFGHDPEELKIDIRGN